MKKFHLVKSTGLAPEGPFAATDVLAFYQRSSSPERMLVWWEGQAGWVSLASEIEGVAAQARADELERNAGSAEAAPAASPSQPGPGMVRVWRDGRVLGEYHEADAPALLRAKVLLPTDLYLSAGMIQPAALSELLLTLLLKPVQAGVTAAPVTHPAPVVIGQGSAIPSSLAGMTLEPNDVASASAPPRCCPHCRSADIQSFEMAYKTGSSSATTVGFTLTGDVGQAHTRSRTNLASEVAPPDRSLPGCMAFALVSALGAAVGLWVAPFNGGLLIGAAVGFFGLIGIHAMGSADRAKRYEEWRNSWVCLKCGHKF